MVIVDTLYHLIERETSTVSRLWKGLQIIGYIVAAASGILSTIWFYKLLDGFSMNCLLYPEIKFIELKPEDKKFDFVPQNMTIDALRTIWNKDFVCQYCMAVWTMSFVGGTILGSFFIVSPRGGKGYVHSTFIQPWKMIYPMALVSLLMAVLTGIATASAIGGINKFCASFENYTHNRSCTESIDMYSLKFHTYQMPINQSQKIVKAFSVLAFIAWTYCVLLLFIRVSLAPDFHLQVIKIKPKIKTPTKKKKILLSQPSNLSLPLHPTGHIENLHETDVIDQTNKHTGTTMSNNGIKETKIALLNML